MSLNPSSKLHFYEKFFFVPNVFLLLFYKDKFNGKETLTIN